MFSVLMSTLLCFSLSLICGCHKYKDKRQEGKYEDIPELGKEGEKHDRRWGKRKWQSNSEEILCLCFLHSTLDSIISPSSTFSSVPSSNCPPWPKPSNQRVSAELRPRNMKNSVSVVYIDMFIHLYDLYPFLPLFPFTLFTPYWLACSASPWCNLNSIYRVN